MTILWDDPPASNVVRLSDYRRPVKPCVVRPDDWFETAKRALSAEIFGDAQPGDSESDGAA